MREKPLQTLAGSLLPFLLMTWHGLTGHYEKCDGTFQSLCSAVALNKTRSHEVWRVSLQTSAARDHRDPPQSLLEEWSENRFFALEAVFGAGGSPWVGGGAVFLGEMFWTAHGRGRGRAQSTAALQVKIPVVTVPGTADDVLSHHLVTAKAPRSKESGVIFTKTHFQCL